MSRINEFLAGLDPVKVIVVTLAFFVMVGAVWIVDECRSHKCEICARPWAIFTVRALEVCRTCRRGAIRRCR